MMESSSWAIIGGLVTALIASMGLVVKLIVNGRKKQAGSAELTSAEMIREIHRMHDEHYIGSVPHEMKKQTALLEQIVENTTTYAHDEG